MAKKLWQRCKGFKPMIIEIRNDKIVAVCDIKEPNAKISEIDKDIYNGLSQHYPVYTVWLPTYTVWQLGESPEAEPIRFTVKQWGKDYLAKEFTEGEYVNWINSLQ